MLMRTLIMLVLLAPTLLLAQPLSAVEAAHAQPAAIIFEDAFENGTLGAGWSVEATGSGGVELNTDYFRSGAQAVFLGQKAAGRAYAELNLALDLTGQSTVYLSYWARATGVYEYRRTYISDNNGASWTEIRDIDELSQSFSNEMIDLAYVANSKGLALNDKFRIRFAYSNYNGRAGGGLVIDDVRLVQRPQAVAAFPLAQEGFESTSFVQGLYPQSYNNGITTITADYPRSGSQSIFIGQNVAGNAGASLILAVDLAGQRDVFLDFWARATGDYEYRRIYISDNSGASWVEIRNLDELSQSFSHEVIDLAEEATGKGLALNARFLISFAYADYNGRAGGGLILDDLRLTQRAQAVAAFPLARDGFEGAGFVQGIYPQSFNNGVAAITSDYPRNSGRSVFLGQNVAGKGSASLVIALDLTGQRAVFLDFWVRSTGVYEYRRVYISDNSGASWVEILDLDETPQSFSHEVIDLVAQAQLKGLALNNTFRVRFTYSNYNGRAGSGLVIDDLQIVGASSISRVYLPLIRRR